MHFQVVLSCMDHSCSYRSLLPCKCLLAAPAGTEERATFLTPFSQVRIFGIEGMGGHLEFRNTLLEYFKSAVYGVKIGYLVQ